MFFVFLPIEIKKKKKNEKKIFVSFAYANAVAK